MYGNVRAEARSGGSKSETNTETVAMRRPASDFVVRTTAYTHTEADSLQYGTKNAYGSDLKFGNKVRSAGRIVRTCLLVCMCFSLLM